MCSLYLAIQMTLLIHIISQEVATTVEWQVVMSMAQNLSRKALADLFITMEAQHAHWHCIKSTVVGEAHSDDVKAMFPPLSSLLNIPDNLLLSILEVVGLMYQQGNFLSPFLHGWEGFIAEF
jgi:hypothetical protein